MGDMRKLKDACIVASYQATYATATALARIFRVSGRTITNVLARHNIRVKMGRPRKYGKEKADE